MKTKFSVNRHRTDDGLGICAGIKRIEKSLLTTTYMLDWMVLNKRLNSDFLPAVLEP